MTCERFVNVIAGFVIDVDDEDVVNIYGDQYTEIIMVVDTWVGVETFEAVAEDIIVEK
jgi:hypothetical protein